MRSRSFSRTIGRMASGSPTPHGMPFASRPSAARPAACVPPSAPAWAAGRVSIPWTPSRPRGVLQSRWCGWHSPSRTPPAGLVRRARRCVRRGSRSPRSRTTLDRWRRWRGRPGFDKRGPTMPQTARPTPPREGEKIAFRGGRLAVPDHAIVPYIEGDGTGPDIWKASVRVFDGAIAKAYGGRRKIAWLEVLAGEKAFREQGEWLPEATLDAFREYLVGIKGPLTTPVGGGIRSFNVALRQLLDLYVCLRPVQYFQGVPSPVRSPQKVNMVIFRENTEDIYAGIEFRAGTSDAERFLKILEQEFPKEFAKIRFGSSEATKAFLESDPGLATPKIEVGIGIKPVSRLGSSRLVAAAIRYAIVNKRKSVTLVHKGNIMKFTEGAFRDWGYEIADTLFGAATYSWSKWERTKKEKSEKAANDEMKSAVADGKILVKDAIADITLQQVLTRPEDFDV